MRKRLFVDCDDTLIVYDNIACSWPDKPCEVHDHPFAVTRGETYKINEPLVVSIKAYVEGNPCALVVIWSGGGAQGVHRAVLPRHPGRCRADRQGS